MMRTEGEVREAVEELKDRIITRTQANPLVGCSADRTKIKALMWVLEESAKLVK